jgi:tRNA(Arg) A34 adenosine deaminase TadA
MVHLAAKIASTSSNQHFRHSVVVEMNGRIVGTGANTITVHAEAMAVANALKKVKSVYNANIWSFRVTKLGKLAMAKPCPNCASYLRSLGIHRVYYSDSDGAIQKMYL